MSCNEWQSGAVTIPTKAFSALYKSFVTGYNDIQSRKLRNMKSLYDYIMIAGKGKRNFDYVGSMELHADMYKVSFDDIEKLFPFNRTKPFHPTKKMFDSANTRTVSFCLDEGAASISFNKADHSVSWGVPENNHACERAHDLPEAQLLFRLLQNIKYTRNSGGEIVGNDEYNRDNMQSGGGANYVVFSFGK